VLDAGADVGVVAPLPRATHEIGFEPAPVVVAKDTAAHVEIKFPFAEQSIRIDKAEKYKVRLKIENWPLAQDGRGVDLVLDDFRPYRVRSLEPIELGKLVPEDATLRPGEHTLVAMAVRENGELVRPPAATSLAPLWCISGSSVAPRASRQRATSLHVQPRGTLNGEAAAGASCWIFAVGVELARKTVLVRVLERQPRARWCSRRGSRASGGRAERRLRRRARADRTRWATAETWARRPTITVNRDAPTAEPDAGG
jgi:hypothetical protein